MDFKWRIWWSIDIQIPNKIFKKKIAQNYWSCKEAFPHTMFKKSYIHLFTSFKILASEVYSNLGQTMFTLLWSNYLSLFIHLFKNKVYVFNTQKWKQKQIGATLCNWLGFDDPIHHFPQRKSKFNLISILSQIICACTSGSVDMKASFKIISSY